MAYSAHGQGLRGMLEAILSTYRRRPGLEDAVRIHQSIVGHGAYAALVGALKSTLPHGFHELSGCVEIRVPLHWHLIGHLRRSLIDGGHASDTLRDHHFAGDLGL